ncbi:sulfatase-like hydrolase/transferase [Novipirellula artificiosorum]|uniref:Choline-sulfatase n=1 Tax=Novipirellula artificiosorum TaxID=2528016 RepID=A0A5C6D5U5_9BACT|nr:sulfatase-like hydrolase/transferase [Novipirellula artificiosorum]TWU32533.1 Choline-sulfatase [Novipirellula artificiosorum]
MAINHHAFPQPEDQGFDWTCHSLGVTKKMSPHRLTGFASTAPDDPFRIDENGYPYHQNNEDAMEFLRESKDQPFFLYYATWLVHSPIQTRSLANLEKYCKKLGVNIPTDPEKWELEGQRIPFYCAMVEELDHHVGRLFDYLDQTEDPRWPGHTLIENTYLIFTSDNSGMEQHPSEIITDNYPLDRGKISAREGGTRVPLIVAGPGIPGGTQSDVMVNGLDFYPTVLSLCGIKKPVEKHLDGCDLRPLLLGDPTDPAVVKTADGTVRDTLVWHFPHSVAMESTIRIGDYKLIRKYDHVGNPNVESELELFRLYKSDDGKQERADIEESANLAEAMPEKAKQMNDRLTQLLSEMKASYPYYNPDYNKSLPHQEHVCNVVSHEQIDSNVNIVFHENGAKVVRANLIYTPNGGQRYEEWYRMAATLHDESKASAKLPEGTTHYFFNLIDENNFLRSYPEVVDVIGQQNGKHPYSLTALENENFKGTVSSKTHRPKTNRQRAFRRWDTNQDQSLSLDEYKAGLSGHSDLERRFRHFETNGDSLLSPDEFK